MRDKRGVPIRFIFPLSPFLLFFLCVLKGYSDVLST